jgi:putative Mg2+ transporter-C (MgtC) family protein
MMLLLAAIFRDHVEPDRLLLVGGRLAVAVALGGLIGFERKLEGKSAGMRTHMLVALGAAVFTLTPLEGGIEDRDLSRVIQGIAAGIGFLGAGTILKAEIPHRVEGLTTAASIWLTAAAGMAVGAGFFWPALAAVVLGWLILDPVHRAERWARRRLGQTPSE